MIQAPSPTDDRILPLTRWVAMLVIPFLLIASAILLFFDEETGQRFAWSISPPMTAALMGTGYLGGAVFFARVVAGRRWHRFAAGFPAVAVFTASMLLATLLHWNRFDAGHFPFLVWLALYIITPILLPWLWRRNNAATHLADDQAVTVPPAIRRAMGLIGGLILVTAVVLFVLPQLAIDIWPWTLSPLTARVVVGWHTLLGAGGLAIAGHRRWSAWLVALESIVIWQLLMLIAAVVLRGDFGPAGLRNWYVAYIILGLLGVGALYAFMTVRTRGG